MCSLSVDDGLLQQDNAEIQQQRDEIQQRDVDATRRDDEQEVDNVEIQQRDEIQQQDVDATRRDDEQQVDNAEIQQQQDADAARADVEQQVDNVEIQQLDVVCVGATSSSDVNVGDDEQEDDGVNEEETFERLNYEHTDSMEQQVDITRLHHTDNME